MRRCAEEHAEDPGRTCILPPGEHYDHQDAHGCWPNPEVQVASARRAPAPGASAQQALQIAQASRPASSARMLVPGRPAPREPLPGTSHAAALSHLRRRGWVTAAELPSGDLYDVYALRDHLHWPIESRRRPGDGAWEYRLVEG